MLADGHADDHHDAGDHDISARTAPGLLADLKLLRMVLLL